MPPITKVESKQPVVQKVVTPVAPKPEVGAAAAMKGLGAANPRPGSISGAAMADAITRSIREPGSQAAGKDFATIKKFVDTHGKQLSPEAKKVFEVFSKQVDLAKANNQTEIDFRSAGKLDRDMRAAARPAADPNAPLPLAKPGEDDHEHGYGKANGKADLGDKLKYGSIGAPKDHPLLKASDLDATEGNYLIGKSKTPVKTSPLKMTHASLDEALEKKLGGKDRFSFKPPFKNATGPEAAQAKMALLNAPTEKGGENDVIVSMGTEGSRKPTLMTTRTDKAGNVEAEIVGNKLPVTRKSFTTVDEAKAAFKKDFGMTIADRPTTAAGRAADPTLKDWTPEELSKMHEGLSRMSPTEQKALDGVKLERRTVVPGHPTWAAEFKSELRHDPTTKEPVRKDAMIVANNAFKFDDVQFAGDGKDPTFPSVRTIAHEAGHAVANADQRTKQLENEKAKFAYNEAVKPHAAVSKKWDTAYGELKGTAKTEAKAFDTAFKDLETKRAALATAAPDKVDAKAEEVRLALNKLTDEAKKLPAAHPAQAQAIAARDSAANMSLLYAKDVGQTGKELAKAQVKEGNENISARQAHFDKYVKDNNIPELTDYAVQGSRHENYAEAYSLYKTDPEWMKTNSPLLYKYFQDNKHLD